MKGMRNSKRHLIQALLFGSALAIATPVFAQGAKNQPRTPYSVGDFAKLKWLEGSWEGTAPGETSLFQRIRFVNDSTAEITYYRDAGFSQESGNGRLYLSVGRVYHTFGSNRWAATHVGADGIYLIPQAARNNFDWKFVSPDSWTSTMRSGVGGHEHVTIYTMKRARP